MDGHSIKWLWGVLKDVYEQQEALDKKLQVLSYLLLNSQEFSTVRSTVFIRRSTRPSSSSACSTAMGYCKNFQLGQIRPFWFYKHVGLALLVLQASSWMTMKTNCQPKTSNWCLLHNCVVTRLSCTWKPGGRVLAGQLLRNKGTPLKEWLNRVPNNKECRVVCLGNRLEYYLTLWIGQEKALGT